MLPKMWVYTLTFRAFGELRLCSLTMISLNSLKCFRATSRDTSKRWESCTRKADFPPAPDERLRDGRSAFLRLVTIARFVARHSKEFVKLP